MKTTLHESAIPVQFKQNLMSKLAFEVDEKIAENYTIATFQGINDFMKLSKSKTEPIMFEIRSLKGEFLFGAIVRYHANENPNMPGNWSYEYTFTESDGEDINKRYLYTDPQFTMIRDNQMYNSYGYTWNIDAASGNKMTIEMINSIRDFLDVNTTEAEPVEITCGDLFVAKGVVEDGEKVFAITPAEKAKIEVKEPKAGE